MRGWAMGEEFESERSRDDQQSKAKQRLVVRVLVNKEEETKEREVEVRSILWNLLVWLAKKENLEYGLGLLFFK